MFIKFLNSSNKSVYIALDNISHVVEHLSNETHIYLKSASNFLTSNKSIEDVMEMINEKISEQKSKEEEKIKCKRSITILNDEE